MIKSFVVPASAGLQAQIAADRGYAPRLDCGCSVEEVKHVGYGPRHGGGYGGSAGLAEIDDIVRFDSHKEYVVVLGR